nr:polysaccharide biosynthesis protein [Bacteroides thetaiotaomicron]
MEFTGLRPGEKLYEEVLSDKENTPTENKKIMIAKVRHYEYTDILDTYTEFEKLSLLCRSWTQ